MPNDVANPFPGESILPMVQIGVHRSENDCWTCGTARRIVYSEPVARDLRAAVTFCSTCKAAVRVVQKRPPKEGRRIAER